MAQTLDNMSYTWNNGSTVFTGIKYNVTDAASSASSLLMDLQVNGVSRFRIRKDGLVYASSYYFDAGCTLLNLGVGIMVAYGNDNIAAFNTNEGIKVNTAKYIGFSSGNPVNTSLDVILARDAANTLAQRNATNPQTFNLYNTYTSGSSYERLKLGWNANNFEIKPESTGTTRYLYISGLPTTNPGPGILWNDAGTVKVGT